VKKKWVFVLVVVVIVVAVILSGIIFSSLMPRRKNIAFNGGIKEFIEKGIIGPHSANSAFGILCKITGADNKNITVLIQSDKYTWYSGINVPLPDSCDILIMHKTNYKPQIDEELKQHPDLTEQKAISELAGKCSYKVAKIESIQGVKGQPDSILFGESGNNEDLKKEIGDDAKITMQISGTTIKLVEIDIYLNRP
jgi:hypothetical protein